MKDICRGHYDDQVIQDIVVNGSLVSLSNGDLFEPNGYLLVSLDKRTCYPVTQIVTMIRYVLGDQQQIMYVSNPKNNQLEKIKKELH